MAKPTRSNSKPTSKTAAAPAPKAAARAASKAPVKTEVRNTPIPRPTPAVGAKPAVAAAAARVVTHEAISRRAYEIWQSGTGGSEYDNWVRAERELRAGL